MFIFYCLVQFIARPNGIKWGYHASSLLNFFSFLVSKIQFHILLEFLNYFNKHNSFYLMKYSILLISFKRFIVFLHIWMCACLCVYTTCVWCLWSLEKKSDTLKLELQKIVSGHVDASNQTCILCKSNKVLLTSKPSLHCHPTSFHF